MIPQPKTPSTPSSINSINPINSPRPSCTSRPLCLRASSSVVAIFTLALLTGCANFDATGMPDNMPLSSDKLSSLRKNMTYAEFRTAFGEGWLSSSLPSESKYWFFDDGRTLVVPPESWKAPSQPLTYHFIGIAAATTQPSVQILQPQKEEIKIATQPKP